MPRRVAAFITLALLAAGTAPAQTPDPYTGHWESPAQGFRIIVYEQEGARQILFYGQVQTAPGQPRYVTRAQHIREAGGALLFELPAHAVYAQPAASDTATAGHRSELPAGGQIDQPTDWRLTRHGDTLDLDCAAPDRCHCGLREAVKLATGQQTNAP